MTNRQRAFWAIALFSVVGGATGAITKIGLFEIPPFSYSFLRFFIASVCILPFVVKRKNFLRDLRLLFPLSLLASINILFYAVGIAKTTAISGQLLYAAVPLATVIIGYLFIRHTITTEKLLGVLLGFVGVILIVFMPIFEKGNIFSGNLSGNLLIGIGVVSFSFYTVFSKKKLSQFSPFMITAAFILVTCVALFPFFLSDLAFHPEWWRIMGMSGVLSLLYSVFLNTILSYILYQYAIHHGGSLFASMTYYLLPVFAYISAFFLLGENLTSGIAVGTILALLGVFFVTRR